MKKITILGSTGSVGTSTLKVVDAMPGRFDVVLLAARRSREALLEQIRRFRPRFAAIGAPDDALWLRRQSGVAPTEVIAGTHALVSLLETLEVDLTVSAIVGAAGLKPTMAAIHAGSNIALANKESMVVAGQFMNLAAEKAGIHILPVDSEHNALHQCLRGEEHAEVKRLILTASGGPFRTYRGDFATITPEQALAHPTWNMGPKITIDSATMMNKGLEVIEAHHLFHFPADRIDIVVHPQSIVHSMIETVDGSTKCQLGKTDMCDPIQYALTWPLRLPTPFETLDITKGLTLEFFPADRKRFPCIQLAYDALNMGGAAPAVLNAANEVAVQAFLDGAVGFSDIPKVNSACMNELGGRKVASLDDLIELDAETRRTAAETVAAVPR
ncbi:MAG: 1-deoxy-D-xylulose-5-phosphate reductoisomerase [Acidobacteriota bacterium]|nr:1-deoxy-D-xylulose-5-phosphate reductoisomerase [Acidobacteriota bacterium]